MLLMRCHRKMSKLVYTVPCSNFLLSLELFLDEFVELSSSFDLITDLIGLPRRVGDLEFDDTESQSSSDRSNITPRTGALGGCPSFMTLFLAFLDSYALLMVNVFSFGGNLKLLLAILGADGSIHNLLETSKSTINKSEALE